MLLFELVVSNNTVSCFIGIDLREYDPCACVEFLCLSLDCRGWTVEEGLL